MTAQNVKTLLLSLLTLLSRLLGIFAIYGKSMEIPIKMWKFSWGYMENQNVKVEALKRAVLQ